MLIVFTCSHCRAGIEASAAAAGSRIACPGCRAIVEVPFTELGTGSRIGGFRIERLIGRGGMGEVYLARQLSMDRDVAVKILPRHLTKDPEAVKRFLHEVRMTARLEHPNIVTAHETGEDDGVYFFAMSYVRGEPLDEKLDRDGPIPEKKALELCVKIGKALSYAWTEHRLLHRDIKPSNIMVERDGEPKLMDMGLSKRLEGSPLLTATSMVMGTPNYMSPEQAEGRPSLDARSDMYSLGVTLYHMLTGRVPFEGSSVVEVLRKQVAETLPDPRIANPAISEACVVLLETMLARNPEDRHAAWDDWLADAGRVLAGKLPLRKLAAAGLSALHHSRVGSPAAGEHHKIVLHAGDVAKMFHAHPHAENAPAPETNSKSGPAKSGRGRMVRRLWLAGGAIAGAVALVAALNWGSNQAERKPAPVRPAPATPAGAPPAAGPSVVAPKPAPPVRATPAAAPVPSPARPPAPSRVPGAGDESIIKPDAEKPAAAGSVATTGGPPSSPPPAVGSLFPGLVLYLSFDEPPAGDAVSDLSGNENHGTAAAVEWTAEGRHGGAFVFGLSNSCVLVRHSPSLALTNVSVLAWIQTTNPDGEWRRIVDKCYNKGFALSRGGVSAGSAGRIVWENSAGTRCVGETSVCDGAWHHVAAVFDGEYSILYIDGKEQPGRRKAVNPPATNDYPLAVGSSRSLPGGDQLRSFDGVIDDVMVFDRALTEAEIARFHGAPQSLVRTKQMEAAAAGRSERDAARRQLADLLLKHDFEAAGRAVMPGGCLAEDDAAELGEMVRRVAALPEVLLESYRRAAGREEDIQLKTGTEKLKIAGVEGDRVLAQRIMRSQGREVGFAQRDFALAETTAQERLRRLGSQRTPDRDIMKGLLAYQAHAPDVARACFEQAGHRLGALLWERVESLREEAKTAQEESARAAQDRAAATAYANLLRSAGFASVGGEADRQRLGILRKKYAEADVGMIRKNLSAFRQLHGRSRFASEHEPVLDALGKVIPGIPLCVDRETVDRAIGKWKLVNGGDVVCAVDVQEEGVRVLAPKNPRLYDLSALAGLPIVALNLRDCRVDDLRPLQGMPLRELDLYNCPASDLSPLRGCPLVSLVAGFDPERVKHDKPLSDLSPLRGMPLEKLTLYNCGPVKDLSPLKGMPLKSLHMNRAGGVEDLRPLRGLPLERLELMSAKASDLSPLAESPLKHLSFSYASVGGLSGFKGLRLESLALDYDRGVFDLALVKDLPLKILSVRGTEVRNRDALKGIPGLKIIDLR